MTRVQLKHALIDIGFMHKAPIRALKGRFGQLSQLCLIEIYLCMSAATDATIDADALDSIIADYPIENPDGFKSYILDKQLIQFELDGYSNSRVIKDQEAYFSKLEKLEADAARKRERRGRSADCPQDAPRTEHGSPDYDNASKENGKKTDMYFDEVSKTMIRRVRV